MKTTYQVNVTENRGSMAADSYSAVGDWWNSHDELFFLDVDAENQEYIEQLFDGDENITSYKRRPEYDDGNHA